MNVADCLTHIDNPEDVPYLRTKLLDVNMRLFKSNPMYKALVLEACELLEVHALEKHDGYKLPHGVSGANLGVPWNIIAVVYNRGKPDAYPKIMINPKIIETYGSMCETSSNCGSIRLAEPIKIKRHAGVVVEFYNKDGGKHRRNYTDVNGGFTIQHEIDHNNGILITDRTVDKPYNYKFPA